MASIPLIEEQVEADFVVLNVEKVGLTDEQFVELCGDNREFQFELTAQKELIITTLPGLKTGRRNEIILHALGNWARQDGTGVSMPPPALYVLPNGSMRAPDASWNANATRPSCEAILPSLKFVARIRAETVTAFHDGSTLIV